MMDPGEMPRVRIMPLFFGYSLRGSAFGEVPISFRGPTFRFNHDEMAGVSLSRPYLELLNVVSNRIGIDSSWIRDVRLELQFHDRLSARSHHKVRCEFSSLVGPRPDWRLCVNRKRRGVTAMGQNLGASMKQEAAQVAFGLQTDFGGIEIPDDRTKRLGQNLIIHVPIVSHGEWLDRPKKEKVPAR